MTALQGSDLLPGSVWHYRRDFDVHVVDTFPDGENIAVVVREYSFPLHVAADQLVDADPAVTL